MPYEQIKLFIKLFLTKSIKRQKQSLNKLLFCPALGCVQFFRLVLFFFCYMSSTLAEKKRMFQVLIKHALNYMHYIARMALIFEKNIINDLIALFIVKSNTSEV